MLAELLGWSGLVLAIISGAVASTAILLGTTLRSREKRPIPRCADMPPGYRLYHDSERDMWRYVRDPDKMRDYLFTGLECSTRDAAIKMAWAHFNKEHAIWEESE